MGSREMLRMGDTKIKIIGNHRSWNYQVQSWYHIEVRQALERILGATHFLRLAIKCQCPKFS